MCEATVTDEDNEADESEVVDDPEFSLQDEGKEVSPINANHSMELTSHSCNSEEITHVCKSF